MRTSLVLIALMFAASAAVASGNPGQTCRPSTPPEHPFTEEEHPGLAIGLNEDSSGRTVGDAISDLAQISDDDEGGPPILRDLLRDDVGLDCPKAR
jgi:hypothetical protein